MEGVVGYIDDWSVSKRRVINARQIAHSLNQHLKFSRVQAEPHNHTPCENKWEAARSEVMAAESSDKQR